MARRHTLSRGASVEFDRSEFILRKCWDRISHTKAHKQHDMYCYLHDKLLPVTEVKWCSLS